MDKLPKLTDTEFDEKVTGSQGLVVVFLETPWCGPCRVMSGTLETLAAQYTDAQFYDMNVDEQPLTAAKYNVLSIPTTLVFKGGELQKQLVGHTAANIEAVREYLND